MITVMNGLPGNVLGFRCEGHVTAQDYKDVLVPTVEGALKTHDKLRLYYETGPDCHVDAGAAWEDAKLGIGHLTRWERMAVVTDIEWLRKTMRISVVVMPGELRVFSSAEARKAVDWLSE